MDSVSATFMTMGVILLLASWVQLLFVAFKDDYSWGLSTLFVPPLAYLYGLFALDKAGAAIFMSLIGWVLIFISL